MEQLREPARLTDSGVEVYQIVKVRYWNVSMINYSFLRILCHLYNVHCLCLYIIIILCHHIVQVAKHTNRFVHIST